MTSVYGQRVKEYVKGGDIEQFFEVEHDFAKIMAPGFLPPYDIFPFLKIIPDFLTPWQGWKDTTQSVGEKQQALYHRLMAGAKERIAQGRSQECFLADILRNNEKHEYSDLDLAYIGGVFLEAGAETTTGAIETFLLAMAAHPSVLKQAQEEVDAFYGNTKMPTDTSNAELPFLNACMLEVSSNFDTNRDLYF